MEENLKVIYLTKHHKGHKTYNGHPSKEDDLIIRDSINMWKGNTIAYDAYDEYSTRNK